MYTSTFITALLPVVAVILLGYFLKRSNFIPVQTWASLEKLTYFILFPALLINTLAKQSIEHAPWLSMLIVIAGTITLSAIVLIAWHRLSTSVSNATFTSIFQGGVRFNTYISLAIAHAYFGAEGLALGAIAAGFMIVFANLYCVSAFSKWGKQHDNSKSFLHEVASNPLIISCAIGWLLSLSGIGLPGATENIIEIIGRAALPFGLLAVGAALKLEALRGHFKAIVTASIIQFGLKPITVFLLASSTGLSGIAAGVLFIIFMTPTSPSSTILARQLGGDVEAMSSIITFQSLFAFAIMPLIAFYTLS